MSRDFDHEENKQEILRVRDKVDNIGTTLTEVKTKLEILVESNNKILSGLVSNSSCEMKEKLLKQELDYKIETVTANVNKMIQKRKDTRTTVVSLCVSLFLLAAKEIASKIF